MPSGTVEAPEGWRREELKLPFVRCRPAIHDSAVEVQDCPVTRGSISPPRVPPGWCCPGIRGPTLAAGSGSLRSNREWQGRQRFRSSRLFFFLLACYKMKLNIIARQSDEDMILLSRCEDTAGSGRRCADRRICRPPGVQTAGCVDRGCIDRGWPDRGFAIAGLQIRIFWRMVLAG
jgi:hypothetical protein